MEQRGGFLPTGRQNVLASDDEPLARLSRLIVSPADRGRHRERARIKYAPTIEARGLAAAWTKMENTF